MHSIVSDTLPNLLREVARNEGVLALWKGFLPYYLRCGGHTVLMSRWRCVWRVGTDIRTRGAEDLCVC